MAASKKPAAAKRPMGTAKSRESFAKKSRKATTKAKATGGG